MTRISEGAHELFLTIINDGKTYPQRKAVGERQLERSNDPFEVRSCAYHWMGFARTGAQEYERQFGSKGASCFTVEDILGAALGLSECYEQHARENAMEEK